MVNGRGSSDRNMWDSIRRVRAKWGDQANQLEG